MARFGQGLNPQLSAVDYSPIMQGTQVAAQGIAQGGAAIGNALAGLGQQFGAALEKRADYKAQIKAGDDAIKAISTLKGIPPEIQAMAQQAQQRLKDPNLSLVEQAKIGAQVNQLFGGVMQAGIQTMMQKQAEAADKQAINVGLAALRTGNDPFSAVQGMGMELTPNAVAFINDYQQSQAKTQETKALAQKAQAEAYAFGNKTPARLPFQDQAVQAAISDFTAQTGRAPSQGELFGIYQTVAQMSRPTTNINMGEDTAAKELGKLAAERWVKLYDTAQQAIPALEKLNEVQQIVSSGDLNTGIASEIATNVDRVRSQFLADQKAGKRVTNDQKLDALLGSDVFPMIGTLGIGARGLDTPAEREFLQNVFTGTRKLDAPAIQELVRIRRDIQIRAIEKYNEEVSSGRMDKFFQNTGFKKSQIEIPDFAKQSAQQAIPDGVDPKVWQYLTPEQKKLWGK